MMTKQSLVRIQEPKNREALSKPSFRWETLLIALLSALCFFFIGYQLVVEYHIVSFGALDQVSRAVTMWHNDPIKVAALGFDYPPLTTLWYAFFMYSTALGSSLVIIPLAGSIIGGMLIASLNHFLRFAQMPLLGRYLVLIATILSPLTFIYAGTSIGAIIGTSMLVLALAAMCYWAHVLDLRYLVLAAFFSGLAVLSNYDNIIWVIVSVITAAIILARTKASRDEVEGSLIIFLVPVVFALAIWTFFNWTIIDNPLYWLESIRTTVGTDPVRFTDASVWSTLGHWLLSTNLLAILVLPMLIITASKTRSAAALMGTVFLSIAFLMPVTKALFADDIAWINLPSAFVVSMISLLGFGLVYLLNEKMRAAILAIGLVVLVVGVVVNFHEIETYPYQNQEGVMIRAIEDRESQEGSRNLAGQEVGINHEYDMGRYIAANIKTHDSVMVDDAQTFGVIALSGKPWLFYDRVAHANWDRRAENPLKPIEYMLISKQNSNDKLAQIYQDSSAGPGLIVHENERYTLYQLKETEEN